MGCNNCLRQLFYISLTALISYQALYNIIGANELGGKYNNFANLMYSVGSLIPGIALGVHATRMVGTKDTEKQESMANSKTYKYICYFYFAIIVGMLLFRVFMQVQWIHQLAPEEIVSYKRSREWLCYYYGILQYGITFVLVGAYTYRCSKINKSLSAPQQVKNTDQVFKQAAVTTLIMEDPIVSQPTYLPTAMV